MKFTITREALLQPLQHVIGAIERRQTLPVLNNVLLESDGDILKFTGMDLEIQLTSQTDINTTTPIRTTLPARKLHDITKLMDANSIIEISIGSEERATIKNGRSRYTIGGLPADNFPNLESDTAEQSVTLPAHVLKQAIDSTKHAIAESDVRYYLNGLNLVFTGTDLRVSASDGHRLAVYTAKGVFDEPLENDRSIIVPKKAVLEMLRIIGDSTDQIKIGLSPNSIFLKHGIISFVSKLIEGKYPDINRVIPKDLNRTIKVEKEAFKAALNRVAILASEKYKAIKFEADTDTGLKLTGHGTEDQAEEIIPMDIEGPATAIGFNATYLLDAINVCQPGQIRILINKTENSCIIEDPANPAIQHIVMPMRV